MGDSSPGVSLGQSPRTSPRGRRVVVAMSGGVDSSLAAALLAEDDLDVVGVTMHLAGESSRCCSLEDADDARRVAESLGIPFYVANYKESFRREVIDVFADEYLAGRTPIPCVACNKRFKFDYLMERAEVFGAASVATGHYARVTRDPESGLFELRRARDVQKDQTYFLFQLDQFQLSRILFPLGELTKEEVRQRARGLGLKTADKPESQEICFVPGGDYAEVVESLRPEARTRGGEIVDTRGAVLGRHGGVHRFTVGQRHGLGISSDRRLYVVRLDAAERRVVVGPVSELARSGAEVGSVSWLDGAPPVQAVRARVQIRHRHKGAEATLYPLELDTVRVEFDEPVNAVSPGQAAVFYEAGACDDDRGARVLGGGWIRG
ncbi:MAG: tRNA 2-thiouridine(34) synthase MnmA [Myxococcota bacterium]|nr:tRNA 2-thiouridine(34) synthase MnmA [Myxococcota bacterium]